MSKDTPNQIPACKIYKMGRYFTLVARRLSGIRLAPGISSLKGEGLHMKPLLPRHAGLAVAAIGVACVLAMPSIGFAGQQDRAGAGGGGATASGGGAGAGAGGSSGTTSSGGG